MTSLAQLLHALSSIQSSGLVASALAKRGTWVQVVDLLLRDASAIQATSDVTTGYWKNYLFSVNMTLHSSMGKSDNIYAGIAQVVERGILKCAARTLEISDIGEEYLLPFLQVIVPHLYTSKVFCAALNCGEIASWTEARNLSGRLGEY